MTATRWLAAIFVSGMAAGALGWASRAPYSPPDAGVAVLRLSWRLRGSKIEHCRTRTEHELEKMPAHMRTPSVCTSELVSYRLMLRIDGRIVDTLTVVPSGAKSDRPIFLLHERPIKPGVHDVEVDFSPIGEDHANRWKPLRYQGRITARAGQVELITLSGSSSMVRKEKEHEHDDDDEERERRPRRDRRE